MPRPEAAPRAATLRRTVRAQPLGATAAAQQQRRRRPGVTADAKGPPGEMPSRSAPATGSPCSSQPNSSPKGGGKTRWEVAAVAPDTLSMGNHKSEANTDTINGRYAMAQEPRPLGAIMPMRAKPRAGRGER